jgi:hypothetical protein
MAQPYTEAVTDNARIVIKRRLRLSANISSNSRPDRVGAGFGRAPRATYSSAKS